VSLQTQATDADGNLLVNGEGQPIYLEPTAATLFQTARNSGYEGYLLGDGIPPTGVAFTAGISFPMNPVIGQYCLRTDYMPKRLFRFSGTRWIKMEDNVRMTMSNLGPSDVGADQRYEGKDARDTLKTSFINNSKVNTINEKQIVEKQSLSKALRPKADE
jgi:hypothetical protein